jgi:hypothetical protein
MFEVYGYGLSYVSFRNNKISLYRLIYMVVDVSMFSIVMFLL